MKKILFILLLFMLPSLVLAAEPNRLWQSKEGKPLITARLDTTENSDPDMVFLLRDGKKWKIPLTSLSKEDQEYVNKVRERYANVTDEIDRDKNKDATEDDLRGEDQYVLLIGVNKYDSPSLEDLKYCVNDMEMLAECFKKNGVPEKNIYMITDDSDIRPTKVNIRKQIEDVLGLLEPEHQVTVAFSGHGVTVKGKQYLCPSDGNRKETKTLISREWVYEQLDNCLAKRQLFIIDACRENVEVSDTSVNYTKAVSSQEEFSTSKPRAESGTHKFFTIASCAKDQISWEDQDLKQGVFMYYLARGLKGAAKDDDDNNITVVGLFTYVNKKTKAYVKEKNLPEQSPVLISGTTEMEDFNIAKNVEWTDDDEKDEKDSTSIDETNYPVDMIVYQTLNGPESLYGWNGVNYTAGKAYKKTLNGIEYMFRWCPPGEFQMGLEPGIAPNSEQTIHRVLLTKGFWMLESEVTQEMWQDVMGRSQADQSRLAGSTGDLGTGPKYPVYRVSLEECNEFCRILSDKLGLTVKLPTEAQWEYACRSGKDRYNIPNFDPFVWYTQNSGSNIHEVKTKRPNPWKLYDMLGNVSEWCSDKYDKDFYEISPEEDPENTLSSSQSYVVRGGSWISDVKYCLPIYRSMAKPDFRSHAIGFRIIMVPNQKKKETTQPARSILKDET